MPKLTINAPSREFDENTASDNLYLLQDSVMDRNRGIKKRFGLKKKFDLTDIDSKYGDFPIDGQYWFQEVGKIIVVCAGDVIAYSDSNGTYEVLGSNLLYKRTKATFTKCSDAAASLIPTLYIANGTAMAKTTGSTATAVSGANIPTNVTHVTSLDTYLITNDVSSKTQWKHSDVGTPNTWAQAYAYSSQAKTDNILGLLENKGQVWVYGKESIEPFYDAGTTTPFNRITGGLISLGVINPYGITLAGNDIYALSTLRDVIIIKAGSYFPLVLSNAYTKRIKALGSLSDVEVESVFTPDGGKYILFNLNDAKLTIVYDINLNMFYEWGYSNASTNKYEQFKGRCYCYAADWNVHLIGDKDKGVIYTIDPDYPTDDTVGINTDIITGVYSFGEVTRLKTLKNVLFNFRRGDGLYSNNYTAPKVYVRFRTDGNKDWGKRHEVDLGKIGQSRILDPLFSNLTFNTIQFRIQHQDQSIFYLEGVYYEV